MKQQFLKAKTDTIRISIYQDNRGLIPSAATIILNSPGGAELEAETAATVNATTGELTYALTTVHTADLDLDYRATWKYTIDSVDYYEEQLFDVVLSRLSIPITDNDLFDELDSLRKTNAQEIGIATAGAVGSLTDTARKEENDFWTGGIVEILEGTGEGQKRSISDYVQSTGVISVSPNWTAPDTTSVYRVVKAYTNKIITCFEKFEQMLYDRGRRAELIMESSQVRIPLIYLTIHFIAIDKRQEAEDKWDLLAGDYWKLFETAFSNMKVSYDEDESGTIDDEEAQTDLNSVRIFRS